ncbi:gluconate transporter [Cryobacterium sp. TMT2-18-3]|nr:gluconate:H+ symporter [Cryobacterium sp. TMT2-42-4]TFC29906.1 gluconate transporter [Cryobacterium sp. TMT2-18-2]TFC32713.1 gluconate transporter [Cryobacterium sp. TMT2-42-4]TFC55856.1 gluconate transporter [Cryobacterium sp. TMT2-15-1]TFC66091.1 gluconate transporter [Cryobacterium sp. TMT2-18-3]
MILPYAAPVVPIEPAGSDLQLILAALVGVAVIILLITWLKVHPFLALSIGAVGVGVGAGLAPAAAVTSFSAGFGATMAGVGILVGFGAMFGKLLADSGGADRIVDSLVTRSSARTLPWTMALIGGLIGLPMFFEVGLVLLIPVIILVARRSGLSLIRIAIPALAGLSVMHGLVPPHPGPLVAVTTLDANLGLTLAIGVLIAIPTVIIAGPIFSRFASRWVSVPVPALFLTNEEQGLGENSRRPSFLITISGILLPVVLMLARSIADAIDPGSTSPLNATLDFLGTPMIALGIAVIYAMIVFGRGGGMDRAGVARSLSDSLPPIAGILLIVGAGGGFKQVLIDTGIGTVIADAVAGSSVSVLVLAWFVAALIRVATGSATVATVTAAGILAPVAASLGSTDVSLMVLAIGAGSLFLSHVNDAGFWLVKEYLGTTVGQNLKTWTVMECLISVVGLAGVLLLNIVI